MDKDNFTTQQIAEKVAQVLKENYFGNEPPVDIYKLLDNYGITVHPRKFPDKHANVCGFVVFLDGEETSPVFVLNVDNSDERKKFTLAHEFGHWILHKDKLVKDPSLGVLYKNPIGDRDLDQVEKEANQFAAQLLVPGAMLQAEHETTSEHSKDLAKEFGVGEDIIRYRLDLQNDNNAATDDIPGKLQA